MSFTSFDPDDIIEGNIVRGVTSTAFSANASSLTSFHTSSAQTASDAGVYQWDLYNTSPQDNTTAEVQFSVAYGQSLGSGSKGQTGATSTYTPTKAVYSQFRQLLLNDPTDTKLFTMGDNTTSNRMYFLTLNRARYKQGINAGNWEIHLSSSVQANTARPLKLIDDSSVSNGNTVNGHLVYNVVSGSEDDGVYTDGNSDYSHWGLFYPELGLFALNGDKLISGSGNIVAGTHAAGAGTVGLQLHSGSVTYTGTNVSTGRGNLETLNNAGAAASGGLSSNIYNEMNGKMHAALNRGAYFALRAEEDVTSTHYFVRAKNAQFNYSTNPTYTTGSNGQLLHTSFIQNPQTFITTIGLYNDQNELLAIAKLSKPLLKNFERETTVRVKLDY